MATWFEQNGIQNFEKHIKPRFAGKPIGYLEIGVLAGDSARWMVNNVLTHPDAYAHLVDPWEKFRGHHPTTMHRFYRRLVKEFADKPNIQFFRMTSCNYWHQSTTRFDMVYIDGEHSMPAVVSDICGAWPLLKTGGVMVLDDYVIRNRRHVLHGVALFAEVFGREIDTVFSTPRQVAFRKRRVCVGCELSQS